MASMLTGLPQCEIMPIPSYSLDSALYQCSIEGLFIELPIIFGLGIITIGGAPAYALKAGVAIVAAIDAYDIYCKVKLAWNSGDYFYPSAVTDLAIATISIITIVALTIHTPIIIKAGVFTAAAIVTCNSFYVAKLAWDSGDYFSSSFTAVVGFAIPIIAYAAPTAPVAAAGVMTYTIALKLAGTYALMHTISCTSGKIGQEYQGTNGLILGRMAGNLLKSQVTSIAKVALNHPIDIHNEAGRSMLNAGLHSSTIGFQNSKVAILIETLDGFLSAEKSGTINGLGTGVAMVRLSAVVNWISPTNTADVTGNISDSSADILP